MLGECGLYGEHMPSVNRMFEAAELYAGVCAPLQAAASAILALHRSKKEAPAGQQLQTFPPPQPLSPTPAVIPAIPPPPPGQLSSGFKWTWSATRNSWVIRICNE